MASLGARIRRAREARQLTQAELAERARVGGGGKGLGHYEADRRDPSATVLRRIADALGVTLDELVP